MQSGPLCSLGLYKSCVHQMFTYCLACSFASEGRPHWVESHFWKGMTYTYVFFVCLFCVCLLSKKLFTIIIRFTVASFWSNSKAQRASLCVFVSGFLFTVCQRREEWRELHVTTGLCEPLPPCPHRHPAVTSSDTNLLAGVVDQNKDGYTFNSKLNSWEILAPCTYGINCYCKWNDVCHKIK